jgi:hypothetical protein
MINTAGAYILVLVYAGFSQGGVAMQEFPNYESCNAAITQIKVLDNMLFGNCIAKEVK